MKARVAAAAGAVLVAAVVGPAEGARRGCPLVVDQADDTKVLFNPEVRRSIPELDLRSLDLTSTRRTLTAVIRVTDLAARSVDAPFGGRWEAQFTVRGNETVLALWADSVATGGLAFYAGYGGSYTPERKTLDAVTGSVDVRRSEIRITAPLDVFEPVAPITEGTHLRGIVGLTRRHMVPIGPAGPIGQHVDWSDDAASHRVGGPSCVR